MVARARYWEYRRCVKVGGGREVSEFDSGSNGPRYDGTDTGDYQVVKLYCVETRW